MCLRLGAMRGNFGVMTHDSIVPCLWFDDDAEAAAALYTRVFAGGRVTATSRYPAEGENPSKKAPGSVLTVEVELCGQAFSLLNGGPHFTKTASISFYALLPTVDDVDRVFNALADGGKVMMPLDAYPWSERFGWVQDRHGVSWQVMREGTSPTIAPGFMFSDAHHGEAQAAMAHWTRALGGTVDDVAFHDGKTGPKDTVFHARFTLRGVPMRAIDSAMKHGFTFNEGVSIQVLCADQGEIDHVWDALLDGGGTPSMCGWLKDRFGVSWQVVPREVTRWMTTSDARARDRAFAAMMPMRKIDIATIETAFAAR